jgi:thiamine kinase-like enzyme
VGSGSAGDVGPAVAAGDSDLMRGVLAERLRTVDGSPVDILACEVTFARSGEGRSLFQYRLSIRNPAAGEPRPQVVTATSYGGNRTARVWDRLQRRLPPADAGALVPAVYAPEHDLLIQVFPFDHQIPALVPILSGPWPPLVREVLADVGTGAWRVAGWQTDPVRYRVGLRATVRVAVRAEDVASGRVVESCYYVKAYANPVLFERIQRGQGDLEAALTASAGPLAIPATVAWLQEERVLVQREAAGTPLPEAVSDPAVAQDAVRRTARALAALHQLPVLAPASGHSLERVGPERVRRNAARLRRARPGLAEVVGSVEAGILAALRRAGDAPTAPVHGDLKPDHVLLDGDRVVMIDFDKFVAGDPMLDVVSLWRKLGSGQMGNGIDLGNPFVEEYLAHVPASWEHRLAPNLAAALLADASKADRRKRDVAPTTRDRGREVALLAEARRVLADSV